MFRLLFLISLFSLSTASADPELPFGNLSGCPFIHEDQYDLGPMIETLQAQLAAELNNRNACKQSIQTIVSNLTPLQDFYKTIDPAIKQKIANSIYANTLAALNQQKLIMEAAGDTQSVQYQTLVSQISSLANAAMTNQIDLDAGVQSGRVATEVYYRSQLNNYVSGVLNAYNSTARSNPNCIGSMGGWGSALSAVMGAFSLGTGLGVNPTAQVIGSAIGAATQLVTLLQDSKVRKAYNDLIKLKNYKTLACTYYAIKKASCEYQRAYGISQDSAKLRQFFQNHFEATRIGEYERYFVNRGRTKTFGDVFLVIAQMGSPLTLDRSLLEGYLSAKAVDFVTLGEPPPDTASDEVIKGWLLRARAFGVSYSEINYNMGGVAIPIKDQLRAATDDIKTKKATITSAEALIRQNLSFLDLRRKLSSDFPNIRQNVLEAKKYLGSMRNSPLIPDMDKGTIDAAINLMTKLQDFLEVAVSIDGVPNAGFEDEIVAKGGVIFEELAKGSVAQLTKQSVLALGGKGFDRLIWAFGVIRNAYLNRDQTENLPAAERFSEYQQSRNALVDVIGNYKAFSGAGVTFRSEDFTKVVDSFESGFRKEMLESLELAFEKGGSIPELKGQTAAHLCALYYPSLESLSGHGLFSGNKPAKYLELCKQQYPTLQLNRLVSDKDFTIDYSDHCTYFNYSREIEIQNILAQLIQP